MTEADILMITLFVGFVAFVIVFMIASGYW